MDDIAWRNPSSPLGRRAAIGGLVSTMFAVAGCSATTGQRSAGEADGSSSDPVSTPPGTDRPPTAVDTESDTTSTTSTAAVPGNTQLDEREPALHVVRRLSYGPTATELAHARALGVTGWVDEQLAPDALDTEAFEARLTDAFPVLAQTAPELIADFRGDGNGPQLYGVLAVAALVRHTTSPTQLHERLVEFWGDHFNAPQSTPPAVIARIVMDREVLRPHALGRFDDLLVAVAQSPAMLRYLDNASSSVGSINENYARELLELHTVGVDGGYTEDDIVSVARLLTGWGFTRDLEFRFARPRHDDGEVAMLGWERPATGDAFEHGVEFLRHLARLPQTARFVCRKLAVRFAADNPDNELLSAMTDRWFETDGEIAEVVRAMVEHPAFATAAPKFNRPWDFYMATLRSLDADLDITSAPDLRAAIGASRDLGQLPFRWPSPDGYPDTELFWLDAGALLARWNLVIELTDPGATTFQTNMAEIVDDLRGATASEVYDGLTDRLRFTAVDDSLRTALSDLTGWNADHRPTDDELDDLAPHLAFIILASPTTLYR